MISWERQCRHQKKRRSRRRAPKCRQGVGICIIANSWHWLAEPSSSTSQCWFKGRRPSWIRIRKLASPEHLVQMNACAPHQCHPKLLQRTARALRMRYGCVCLESYFRWSWEIDKNLENMGNHQTCLLLSRACFIQGVSKFSAAQQLEKRTKEECTDKTRNVTNKAPTRTPKHSNMGLWEGPGGFFSWSWFSTGLWIAFWPVLVPLGEPWGPFRLLWGPKTAQGIGINLRFFVEHGFV